METGVEAGTEIGVEGWKDDEGTWDGEVEKEPGVVEDWGKEVEAGTLTMTEETVEEDGVWDEGMEADCVEEGTEVDAGTETMVTDGGEERGWDDGGIEGEFGVEGGTEVDWGVEEREDVEGGTDTRVAGEEEGGWDGGIEGELGVEEGMEVDAGTETIPEEDAPEETAWDEGVEERKVDPGVETTEEGVTAEEAGWAEEIGVILTKEMETGEEEGVPETCLEDCGVKVLLGKMGPLSVAKSGPCAIAPRMWRERETRRRELRGDIVKSCLGVLTWEITAWRERWGGEGWRSGDGVTRFGGLWCGI
jgi:hypothetical protein